MKPCAGAGQEFPILAATPSGMLRRYLEVFFQLDIIFGPAGSFFLVTELFSTLAIAVLAESAALLRCFALSHNVQCKTDGTQCKERTGARLVAGRNLFLTF